MEWVESIREAIGYIEENLTNELTIEEISKHVLGHVEKYNYMG